MRLALKLAGQGSITFKLISLITDSGDIEKDEADFGSLGGPETTHSFLAVEQQEEIYNACLQGGDAINCAFIESLTLNFRGELSQQVLEQSLQTILGRHEILRGVFSLDGLKVNICREQPISLVFLDVSDKRAQQASSFVAAYIAQDVATPFDLNNGPLYRFALFQTGSGEYSFIVTVHKAICDSWSLEMVLLELSVLYNATISGEAPGLPGVPVFRQYAEEQSVFRTTTAYQRILMYWRHRFAGYHGDFRIAANNETSSDEKPDSISEQVLVPADAVVGVWKLARSVACNPETVLLVIIESFLQKMNFGEETVIGLVADGQTADGHGAIGQFANLLPLRNRWLDGDTFLEHLEKSAAKIVESYENQQIGIVNLFSILKPTQGGNGLPVPLLVNMSLDMQKELDFKDLSHSVVHNPRAFEYGDNHITVSESIEDMVMSWSARQSCFNRTELAVLLDNFAAFITNLVQEPDLKLAEVSLERKDPPIAKPPERVPKITQHVDVFNLDSSGNLFTIKRNGDKSTLWVICESDADATGFADMSAHMDPAQPVCGLAPASIDEPKNIPQLAAEYIAAIAARDPVGPYLLAGYEYGGYIAMEMAQQLRAAGSQVKLLAMLNCYAFTKEDTPGGSGNIKNELSRQASKVGFFLNSLLKQPMELIGNQSVDTNVKLKRALSGTRPGKDEATINRFYERAYRDYVPKSYDGIIDLFRADKRLSFVDDPKYLGWKQFAGKGIRVHEVPGDHKGLLYGPHAKDFARLLQDALDSASK